MLLTCLQWFLFARLKKQQQQKKNTNLFML